MSRLVNCPRCGKQTKFSSENPYRPFCSERCHVLDLGAWAEEKYAIPGDETADEVNKNQNENLENLENEPGEPGSQD